MGISKYLSIHATQSVRAHTHILGGSITYLHFRYVPDMGISTYLSGLKLKI